MSKKMERHLRQQIKEARRNVNKIVPPDVARDCWELLGPNFEGGAFTLDGPIMRTYTGETYTTEQVVTGTITSMIYFRLADGQLTTSTASGGVTEYQYREGQWFRRILWALGVEFLTVCERIKKMRQRREAQGTTEKP